MAYTAQAYAFAAAGRSAEGLGVLDFLPDSANEVGVSETDPLIMRGRLSVYLDDLAGAIADLGVGAARIRAGLPASYPVHCLTHLSDAHFRHGDWDAATTYAQLATSLAQDADRPMDLARAHARAAQVLSLQGQWSSAQAHVRAARDAAQRFPRALAVAHSGEEPHTMAAMRSRLMAYSRGMPAAKQLREQFSSVSSLEGLAAIAHAHLAAHPACAATPEAELALLT